MTCCTFGVCYCCFLHEGIEWFAFPAIHSVEINEPTYYNITSQNTMYCGGEPEHHIRNVTSRISIIMLIAHKHDSCTCHESNLQALR